MKLARIAITSGEPAGIGPELLVRAAQQNWPAQIIAIADPQLLHDTAASLGLPLKLHIWNLSTEPKAATTGELWIYPVTLSTPAIPGQLDTRNSPYVLETLAVAARGANDANFDAVVTAPVHKGIINDAGVAFTGHTEFFAEQAQCAVVMMLVAADLRVALATTHLPLRAVADAIQSESLERTLRILHTDLRDKFALQQPRILVLGLNPHAGEGGHLGCEEIDIIIPVLQKLRAEDMELIGPMPADTAFLPRELKHCDAVLAMYHDQGLPVLKHAGFGSAVNISLGLPWIRTSVDLGTALDLAGTGRADAGSLIAATRLAIELAAARNRA